MTLYTTCMDVTGVAGVAGSGASRIRFEGVEAVEQGAHDHDGGGAGQG
ncbi:MAG: hypothetical protein R3F43_03895 [bacterium]